MHYPFPMIIIVRQFNFHLQESCCTNFSKKKTLIGYNTFVRMYNCSNSITHSIRTHATVNAFSHHFYMQCVCVCLCTFFSRSHSHFGCHLVIPIANFMLLLARSMSTISANTFRSFSSLSLSIFYLFRYFSRRFYFTFFVPFSFFFTKWDSLPLYVHCCSAIIRVSFFVISIFISLRIS